MDLKLKKSELTTIISSGVIFVTTLALCMYVFNSFEYFFTYYFLLPVAKSGYIVLNMFVPNITFDITTLALGACNYVFPHHILIVNFGCTGIYVLFIILSAVVAYPSVIMKKLKGIGFIIPIFLLYSIIRLIIMGIIGYWFTGGLDFVHEYLMIIFNVAFILWLFSSWLNDKLTIYRSNFLSMFIGSSFVGLVIWKPLSFLYLYVLSIMSNVVFTIITYPVELFVSAGNLKILYPSFDGQQLQFIMGDADQIFLNILIFAALMISSHKVNKGERFSYGLKAAAVLGMMHVMVVFLYTYTNAWEYIATLPEPVRITATQKIEALFPKFSIPVCKSILFHWNSWGWDLMPLLLWLLIAQKQFIKSWHKHRISNFA